jgi:peptidoglycan/xylan/chitin deacetylase (PgdA/CDA1 family)
MPLLAVLGLAAAPLAAAGGPPLCSGHPATIVGTASADHLQGTIHDDVIWGGSGDDRIDSGPGNDLVCAGPGNDGLFGEGGRDTLLAGGGADTIDGGSGDDAVFGGPGPDRLLGGSGADHLAGADGDDTLDGGPGTDALHGGSGADVLEGGGDGDALRGGEADDKLDGGDGVDGCDGGPGRDRAASCEQVAGTEEGQVPLPLLRPGPHQVALTFDDGPAYTYTEQILDILARYDVTATFFIVGRHGAAQRELLRRVAAEGHSVQNHSWDHYHLTRYSDAFVADQLVRTNQLIEEVTGTAPRCLRPPYGSVNDRVRAVAAGLGMATIMWDVNPSNWSHPGAGSVAYTVLHGTGGGDIVLLHDLGGPSTIGALPAIIEGLRARGYEFVPLCTVPGVAPRLADPGR